MNLNENLQSVFAMGRKCIAYGAGNALLGIRAVQQTSFEYVVDDTPGFAGQMIDGLPIYGSESLRSEKPGEVVVVICANTPSSVLAISRRLLALGYQPGLDFMECSQIQWNSMRMRLREQFGIDACISRLNSVRALSLALRPLNLSTIAGTWLLVELLQSLTGSVAGGVAECGVYQGANALISSALCTSISGRSYDLYDSFEGLTECGAGDPGARKGEFGDVDMCELKTVFAALPNVNIVKGRFADTLPRASCKEHALVYIDCDLLEPTLQCCEHFWPQVSKGGYLVTHDYWFPSAPLPKGSRYPFGGVKQAFDRFCAKRHLAAVVFPETGHAVIRKKASSAKSVGELIGFGELS